MQIDYLNHMGDDLTVVNAARVSMAKQHEEFDPEKDSRLIRYLASHGHWTPFAHVMLQYRVSAPIFIARQWYRHTVGIARNEVSRRYVTDDPKFWVPDQWRSSPKNVKQGSSGPLEEEKRYWAESACTDAYYSSRRAYYQLLAEGVCPEQARAVLPQGAYTEWIETSSLYACARICRERLGEDAQVETQLLARQLADLAKEIAPVSWHELMEDKE